MTQTRDLGFNSHWLLASFSLLPHNIKHATWSNTVVTCMAVYYSVLCHLILPWLCLSILCLVCVMHTNHKVLKHSNVCIQFHLSDYSLHTLFARNVYTSMGSLIQTATRIWVTGGLARHDQYILDTSQCNTYFLNDFPFLYDCTLLQQQ